MMIREACREDLNVRPYAFIENVVTQEEYRGKGYASACLDYAKKISEEHNCG